MERKSWYQLSAEETLRRLESDRKAGLTAAEAKRRLESSGTNELREKKKISPLALFLNQFRDFMVLVLVGARSDPGLLGEYLDAITIIGHHPVEWMSWFYPGIQGGKSLRALKRLSAPKAKVIRREKTLEIGAIHAGSRRCGRFWKAGDRIPADIRFLETNGVFVEESALTGESVPVAKR